MKRVSILLVFFVISVSVIGKADDDQIPEPSQNPNATYRLFRTKNIYTFLKLDTRTGQIWQLQWGPDDDHRFAVVLNKTVLVMPGTTDHPTVLKPGRFTLNPTANIFNFLLIDQEDGRIWEVQWGVNEGQRLILPIN